MSIRSAILASAASVQADVPLAVGDVFIRGGRMAFVTEAGARVRWIDGEGEEESGTAADFRGRALIRDTLPAGRSAAYIEGAWQIASARGIDAYVRIIALTPVLKRATSAEDRAKVTSWMRTLIQRMEPER